MKGEFLTMLFLRAGYTRKAFPWYSGKLPQGEKVSEESLKAALAYRPREKRLNKPNLTEAGLFDLSNSIGCSFLTRNCVVCLRLPRLIQRGRRFHYAQSARCL